MSNEQTNTTDTPKPISVLIYRAFAPRRVDELSKALAIVHQHSTQDCFAEIITPTMTLTFRGNMPITVKTPTLR
jgi:hypothetical protein